MTSTHQDWRANIERFSGFASTYDRCRASPPDALASLLKGYLGGKPLATVVDLGSGTGLSTRYWAHQAARVIGIEPTPDMRAIAVAHTADANVTYLDTLSHMTGIDGHSVDVVTCGQSLHWMLPQPTFAEAARILRPGGVFAAYDYDWPPATGSWAAEAAFEDCMRIGKQREIELNASDGIQFFDKAGHLDRMRSSPSFRYTRDFSLHHTDSGNAERLVGLLLSQGFVMTLLKRGLTEAELGIDRLRVTADRTLGPRLRPWYWSSQVRIGIV